MKPKPVTRRRFLALSGAAMGICAMSCAGLEVLMAPEDNSDTLLPIGFPELALGGNNASTKILVAYASAAGSTGGIAETIGKALAGSDVSADIRRVQSVTNLDRYDAVVLGSAIHGGKWLAEAADFLQNNRERLNQVPTAFFLAGLMPNKNSEADRKMVAQFLAAERELVPPVAEGRFLGAMFTKHYPGVTGFGMHFFIAYCGLGWRGGDFRNPAAVRSWAESIRPLLIR